MARPAKQGIDYFPMDVDLDQDDKLGMIIGEFGEKGEKLWIKLLSWIYKNNGYYTEWGEDVQLKFLRRYNYCGFSMGFLKEVVPRFIKWELLDQVVFNTFHMLTSVRIQKTWLDATRKRKDREIDTKIWLLGVIDGLAAEETKKKAEETIQSKVKKSKVKKRRLNPPSRKKTIIRYKPKDHELFPPPTPSHSPPLEEVKRFFTGAGGTVEMAEAFWNKWEGLDWKLNGTPIKKWGAFANNFIASWHRNEKDKKNGQQPTAKGNTGNHGQSAGAIKLARSLAADCGYPPAGGVKDPEP